MTSERDNAVILDADGTLRLLRRKDRGGTWFAKITVPLPLRSNPRNPYCKRDLGVTDRDQAVQLAWLEHEKIYKRIASTGSLSAKSMRQRADDYLAWAKTRTKLLGRDGRPLFKMVEFARQQTCLNRYIVPFFDEKQRTLESLTTRDVEEFLDWRRGYYIDGPGRDRAFVQYERAGKVIRRPIKNATDPAGSTLQKDLVALRGLFKFHKIQPPTWDAVPANSTARPGFSDAEFDQLRLALHVRTRLHKPGEMRIQQGFRVALDRFTAQRRHLLKIFVMFMSSTGLRPQECMWLRFVDIQDDPSLEDGKTRIHIRANHPALKHKSHARVVVPRPDAVFACGMLMAFYTGQFIPWLGLDCSTPPGGYLQPDLMLSRQSWLWMHPDGSRIESFDAGFDEALSDAGLLMADDGQKRSPYSLRHHYATDRIRAGIPISHVADNMGTSEAMLRMHYKHTVAEHHAEVLGAERPGRGSIFDLVVSRGKTARSTQSWEP